MKTIKEYVLENFDSQQIIDICGNGMACGFGNLIYYTDTCAFHDLYEEEIWDMLESDREEMGCKTIVELIVSFNGQKNVGSLTQLKNLLCWYAVEKVCFDLMNEDNQ